MSTVSCARCCARRSTKGAPNDERDRVAADRLHPLRVQLRHRGPARGAHAARIRGDKAHPGSQGYTCNKAMRLDHYQNGRHRLTSPLRRRADGSYEEIDWDTAIAEVAAGFAAHPRRARRRVDLLLRRRRSGQPPRRRLQRRVPEGARRRATARARSRRRRRARPGSTPSSTAATRAASSSTPRCRSSSARTRGCRRASRARAWCCARSPRTPTAR